MILKLINMDENNPIYCDKYIECPSFRKENETINKQINKRVQK